MKVLLLAGGWSPEREVSLKGGEQIAAALKERGHSVTLCDPAKDFERLMDMAREHDAAFINLHGAPGEDGLVQAILDRVNCPYQGAGPAGSFLALHKAAARQIFRDAGLNIPDGVFLPRHPGPNWKPDLQYPMFVKSNTGGSSLHLSRVTNEEELYTALNSLATTSITTTSTRPTAHRKSVPRPLPPKKPPKCRTPPSAPTTRSDSRATAAPTSSFRMTALCISLKSTPRRA